MIKTGLVLSANERYWDYSAERLHFLSEGCCSYTQRRKLDASRVEFSICPWKDQEAFSAAHDYVDELTEEIIKNMTPQLNSLHGVDISIKGWRIILKPWLESFVAVMYDKYICLLDFTLKSDNFSVLAPDKKEWVIWTENTIDYFNKIGEDDYNMNLALAVLDYLGFGSNIKFIESEKQGAENIAQKQSSLPKIKRIALGIYKRIIKLSSKHCRILLSDSYFPIEASIYLFLMCKGKLGFRYTDDSAYTEAIASINYDSELRRRIHLKIDGQENKQFEKMITKFVPLAMPKAFIEGFRTIHEYSQLSINNKTNIIGSSIGWYYDEVFKISIGSRIGKEKLTLFGMQHGGNYGVVKYVGEIEFQSVDKYYTWGWQTDPGDTQFIGMPATKLLQKINNTGHGGILFVGTTAPRFIFRFFVRLEANIDDYFRDQLIFLSAVDNKVFSALTFREYPLDFGRHSRTMLTNAFKDIRFDNNRRFKDSLGTCKLCVSDNINTTYIESLVINKPTIIFSREEYYELTDIGKAYFDILKKADIYHSTPESAAAKINEIYDHLDEWWNEPERQAAVREFVNNFAYYPKGARKIWAKEFKNSL